MTGPEHYLEAERLLMLGSDSGDYDTDEEYSAVRAAEVARAQVHATLAAAAAAVRAAEVARAQVHATLAAAAAMTAVMGGTPAWRAVTENPQDAAPSTPQDARDVTS